MVQTEAIILSGGEERREFRRALISAIGAHRIDHPEGDIDFSQIFPDLFRKLRDHFATFRDQDGMMGLPHFVHELKAFCFELRGRDRHT